MSSLLVKPAQPDDTGRVSHVTPETAGWRHVGFSAHTLTTGQQIQFSGDDQEVCIVVLTGSASVGAGEHHFVQLGGRSSVFDQQAPGVVYVPNDVDYRIVAESDCEIALCRAPGKSSHGVREIKTEQMSQEVRGSGSNTRYVRNILPETEPADSLLVVEVVTPAGNWSSYPPHKHDTDNIPQESSLEETYYHRLNPPQGFAFQRVYTDERDIDETLCVEDGDVVLVPRGYHPVAAAHGYDNYYLNVMAGPTRVWHFRNDPAHEWMLEQ